MVPPDAGRSDKAAKESRLRISENKTKITMSVRKIKNQDGE